MVETVDNDTPVCVYLTLKTPRYSLLKMIICSTTHTSRQDICEKMATTQNGRRDIGENMAEMRHEELKKLDRELRNNNRSPWIALPFLSTTYDGLGSAFSFIAAVAALGLSIPLPPLYGVGLLVGSIYFIVKLQSTRSNIAVQKKRLKVIEQNIITDYNYEYWRSVMPSVIINNNLQDTRTFVNSHSAENIAIYLGNYYRRICRLEEELNHFEAVSNNPELAAQLESTCRKISAIRARLERHISGEGSQFKNPRLTQMLNTACGKQLATVVEAPIPSLGQQFWINLRKYYKSVLSGAATAAGLTVIIVTSALTTATLTILFPWSLIGIGILAVIGGYVGYHIDKRWDRKHKDNLDLISAGELALNNKKRLMNLLVETHATNGQMQALIEKLRTARGAVFKRNQHILQRPKPASSPEQINLEYQAEECVEVQALRRQSHAKRYIADHLLPIFLAIRTGLGDASSLLAGVLLVGLSLPPLWPARIIAMVMLTVYVGFKIYNNRIKHQGELIKVNDLNLIITPEKYQYWEAELHELGPENAVLYVKRNTSENILTDLIAQYRQLQDTLRRFTTLENYEDYRLTQQVLLQIHGEVYLGLRAHAAALHNKEHANRLFGITEPLPEAPAELEPAAAGSKLKQFAQATGRLLLNNGKDIFKGFSLGAVIALTVFTLISTTALVGFLPWSAIIIIGAGLAGIGIKLAIRHGIKAGRSHHLNTIESASQSIKDKEQLMDLLIKTKRATAQVTDMITKCASQNAAEDRADSPEHALRPAPTPQPKAPSKAFAQALKPVQADNTVTPFWKKPQAKSSEAAERMNYKEDARLLDDDGFNNTNPSNDLF
jgi:hypothetical protein